LCEDFYLLWQRDIQHRALAAQQFVDSLSQGRPMRLRQIEMAAQIEQSGLLDGAAHPSAVHQAVGGIGLA
jgi:hypothetical protein